MLTTLVSDRFDSVLTKKDMVVVVVMGVMIWAPIFFAWFG